MKNKNSILLIIVALVLVFSLAACGQKTEEAVNKDNMEKSAPPIENTLVPDNTDSASVEDNSDTTDINENVSDENPTNEDINMETKTFTLAELSIYNGSNGMPAYVAVDGVVYDLTDSAAWRNGKHNGFTAGRDLSDEIKEISPHGVKNLEGIPVVGKLVAE